MQVSSEAAGPEPGSVEEFAGHNARGQTVYRVHKDTRLHLAVEPSVVSSGGAPVRRKLCFDAMESHTTAHATAYCGMSTVVYGGI